MNRPIRRTRDNGRLLNTEDLGTGYAWLDTRTGEVVLGASMDNWEIDDINLVEQGRITLDGSGGVSDEGDEVSGHGHAKLVGKDRLVGMIRFHAGDESGFVPRRAGAEP